MADVCLAAIGVETSAAAVAAHYGARAAGGLLDAWLLAEEDAGARLAEVAASRHPLGRRAAVDAGRGHSAALAEAALRAAGV